MSRYLPSIAAFPLMCGLLAASSLAQGEAPRTIRVTGTGAAAVSPNLIELRGTLSAEGDTVEEATEEFAKAKDKVSKAIEGGKSPQLAVEFAGERLTSGAGGGDGIAAAAAAAAAFGAGAPADGKFTLTEEVVLRMDVVNDMQRAGIVKQLGGVIDKAAKSGLKFGGGAGGIYAQMGLGISSGIVQFGLTKERQTQLRQQAYASAFSDARARAAALAKLSGGQVGKVISVEEVAATGDGNSLEAMQMNMLTRMFGGEMTKSPLSVDHNGQIELQQQITVTFQLD